MLAGIEFSLTGETGDNKAAIKNALVVGRSRGNSDKKQIAETSPRGIITPRTENFTIDGVKFFNFDWENVWKAQAATFGSCSHCFHPAATDSGARTVRFKNLAFTNVTTKIRYQFPWKAIYLDLDGSLTGKGANSWATYYYAHHDVKECVRDAVVFDGVTCDNTI